MEDDTLYNVRVTPSMRVLFEGIFYDEYEPLIMSGKKIAEMQSGRKKNPFVTVIGPVEDGETVAPKREVKPTPYVGPAGL